VLEAFSKGVFDKEGIIHKEHFDSIILGRTELPMIVDDEIH
jgi:hypothetical protein